MKNQSPSNTPDLFSGLDRKKLKDAFYDALSTLTKDQKKAVEPRSLLRGMGISWIKPIPVSTKSFALPTQMLASRP